MIELIETTAYPLTDGFNKDNGYVLTFTEQPTFEIAELDFLKVVDKFITKLYNENTKYNYTEGDKVIFHVRYSNGDSNHTLVFTKGL